MSLRRKSLLISGITLGALMLILFTFITTSIMNGFDTLQKQDVRKDLDRASSALNQECLRLDYQCQNLAFKADTTNYFTFPDANYINSNFSDTVFQKINLNFTTLLDSEGHVKFKKAFDIGSNMSMPFPESIINNAYLSEHYHQILVSQTGKSGILVLPESPAFYSIWPVMDGGMGQAIGMLVLGRYLDSNQVHSLATVANLYHFNIYQSDLAVNQSDMKTILPQLNTGVISPVQYLDDGFIAGYTFVNDLENHPTLIIKVDKPSSIYQAGMENARVLLFFLLGAGIIFVIIMILVIDRLILARLLKLKTEVARIDLDSEIAHRATVTVSGRDELSSLSETVNQMIDKIARSQKELKKSGDDLKQALTAEQKLRQALEDEIKKRAEFFRALVHELKTPLTPVLSSSESIIAMAPDDMTKKLGESIYRGAERLNNRVDELLDIAKGEMGVLKVKRQPMNLIPLIKETANCLQSQSATNHLTLQVDLPETELNILGDEERLGQVLLNLLDNALKFTPPGGTITIRGRLHEDSVVVDVEDNGRGIDPEEKAHIFQPYNRLESDRQYFSGLGLGLALCKQLVELHDGEIWVNSQKGKGAVFSFSIPVVKQAEMPGQDASGNERYVESGRDITGASE